MPELPEVETTVRALRARLAGRRITTLVQRRADLRFPLPSDLKKRLLGVGILGFTRRAKYVLGQLDDGQTLMLHLGMSGRLLFDGEPAGAHEHLTFGFDDGSTLRFVDPRRFGMLDLVATNRLEQHPRIADLGLEPLDHHFDGTALHRVLSGRQSPLKIALMNQRLVVGVGNIYACESLFHARLSPKRLAGRLRLGQCDRLAQGIRWVLQDAIAAGGSSLRDYVQTDGTLGVYQNRFAVYARAGCPCPACGHQIVKIIQANRATFACFRCQR